MHKTTEKKMTQMNGFFALVLGTLVLLPGCWQKEQEKPVKKTGLVVVNVLDKDTFADCHIANSINIPFDSIEASMDTIDKDAQIVFYCANPLCTASEYAAKQFQKAGFTNVSVYEGGTAEWYQKGLPVEGTGCADYLRQPVKHVTTCDAHACTVLSVEELAQKMGYELPKASNPEQEVALGEQCMMAQVAAAVEIPVTK